MNVICLVPSLTETLIECGVNVVGRTKFCIHPIGKVEAIAKVGGTKNVDWTKCENIKPDLVVFDKEENNKEMADSCPYPWVAVHITSVDNIGKELSVLANKLNNMELEKVAKEWNMLSKLEPLSLDSWMNIPGCIDLLNNKRKEYSKIEYVIWKQPWMVVGEATFINSMLHKVGFGDYISNYQESYPEIELEKLDKEDTFILFSSEPYPFEKDKDWLNENSFNGAIVDGEFYSWFGIRSMNHLKELYQLK